MPQKKIKASQSNDPPPADFVAGGGFSMTLTDTSTDWPLPTAAQVRIKFRVSVVAGTKG
jgi:hypothetical protein